MKTQLVACAIALSLSACASNMTLKESKAPVMSQKTGAKSQVEQSPQKQISALSSVEDNMVFTLEKIMSDPDWVARTPSNWYWGDDSQSFYYNQKRLGSPVEDLYKHTIDGQAQPHQVLLSNKHLAADRLAKHNQANTHKVYVFEGNVFVKNIATQSVSQLTYTSAIERDAMFLRNGNIAYRVENKFFEHDLRQNQVKELASLIIASSANDTTGSNYLAQEQSELIDYIAIKQRHRYQQEQESARLRSQNATITKSAFYFDASKKIVHASLSPNGDKLLVSITDNTAIRSEYDFMPNYITETGDIGAEPVRARVANNRQYKETLYLLDLKSGIKFHLDYNQLPGFDEDVLAKVKRENLLRKGKEYQPTNAPRNIHVMGIDHAIQWHENGLHVALMLEAWDNKDRWLATVNLLENKLVSQHRLHDEAWVNTSFNEFG